MYRIENGMRCVVSKVVCITIGGVVGDNSENMVNVNAEQVEEFLLNDEAVYMCAHVLL